jgi:hypothetical protein
VARVSDDRQVAWGGLRVHCALGRSGRVVRPPEARLMPWRARPGPCYSQGAERLPGGLDQVTAVRSDREQPEASSAAARPWGSPGSRQIGILAWVVGSLCANTFARPGVRCGSQEPRRGGHDDWLPTNPRHQRLCVRRRRGRTDPILQSACGVRVLVGPGQKDEARRLLAEAER